MAACHEDALWQAFVQLDYLHRMRDGPILYNFHSMTDIEMVAVSAESRIVCDGYPAIASFVASDPDHEAFVFRRFSSLTARKLLYMQSELLDLEERLAQFDRDAAASLDPEVHLSARCWETFMANAAVRDEEREAKRLIEEIEVRLDRYHQALLLQSQIARLERPSDRVLSAYREALHGVDGKDPKLGGKAQYMLDDDSDLAVLNSPLNNDAVSRVFRTHWFFKHHPQQALDHNSRTRYFDEKSLTWKVNVISTLIAAVLLIGSITALYFVQNDNARLGIVLSVIVLFALGLSVTTSASREAIFAATAAYSAVLIVYISGNTSHTSSTGGASGLCNGTVAT